MSHRPLSPEKASEDAVLSSAEMMRMTLELENHANGLALAAHKFVVEMGGSEKSSLTPREQLRLDDLKERLALYTAWKKEQA